MQSLVEKSLELLQLIIEEWLELSNNIELRSDELRNIYVQILFKITHSLEGALVLLYNYRNKPFYQLAYMSTMRDVVSDIVLAEYLSCKSQDKTFEIQTALDQIYADHYIFMERQLKLNKELFGHEHEYDDVETKFIVKMTKFKDDDGKIQRKYLKNSGIFDKLKYINSQTKQEDKIFVRSLYQWYSTFSKVSHFGDKTFDIIQEYMVGADAEQYYSKNRELLITGFLYTMGLLDRVRVDSEGNEKTELKFKELLEIKNVA